MWQSKPPAGIQLNRNHPLAQGLVACWMFNEGSGLRANDLCGMNHGTLTGFEPMSATSGWTGTPHGTGLRFDGVDDYIIIGDNNTLNFAGTHPYTMETLINTPINGAMMLSKFNIGVSGQYLFGISGNAIDVEREVPPFDVTGNTIVPGAGWIHAIGTYDGSNVMIYINGVSDITPVASGSISSTNDVVLIGARLQFGLPVSFFQGIMSHLRVWERALSPQESQQLFAQPYSMFLNPSERIRKYDNHLLM